MAYTTIAMKNSNTGEVKEVPIGFSWTYLFFGPIVCLIRKHYSGYSGFWLTCLFGLFTSGLYILVMAFYFNKNYCLSLMDEQFKPVGNLANLKISDKVALGLSIEDKN